MVPGVAVTHATFGSTPFWVCGVTAAHRVFTQRGKSSNLFRSTTIGFRSIGRTPDSESGNGSSTLSIRTAADCCTCESTVSRARAHCGTTATRCGRGMTTEYEFRASVIHVTRRRGIASVARMQSSRFLPGSVLVQVQPEAPFALAARRSCSGFVIRRRRFNSDRGLDVMRVPRVRSRQATHLVMRSQVTWG